MKNEKEQLWPASSWRRVSFSKSTRRAGVAGVRGAAWQDGSFVYIAKEGRAQIQNVQVDRQIDELVVISKGLSGGEEIIKDVPPTLSNGSAIVLQVLKVKGGKARAARAARARSHRTRTRRAKCRRPKTRRARRLSHEHIPNLH